MSPATASASLAATTTAIAPTNATATVTPLSAAPPAEPQLRRAPDRRPGAPRIRAVPDGTEARGFALYVGLDEHAARAAGVDLGRLVTELKATLGRLVPNAETYAAVALAPAGAGGRNVDVVRLALQDPSAVAQHRHLDDEPEVAPDGGVLVDLSRKQVMLDDGAAQLTYKEFELLQYLVLREGRTVDRAEIIAALWGEGDDDVPNERTIDVHVRRLRAKLGGYQAIVRTVRGVGYRFDRHADVVIRYATGPSPDLI